MGRARIKPSLKTGPRCRLRSPRQGVARLDAANQDSNALVELAIKYFCIGIQWTVGPSTDTGSHCVAICSDPGTNKLNTSPLSNSGQRGFPSALVKVTSPMALKPLRTTSFVRRPQYAGPPLC
jgi:hypothetical protein